jgi:ankyrin repeat protein
LNFLIKKDVNVNIQEKNYGETLLHKLIKDESAFNLIEQILSLGGDCNILNNEGNSPLHLAIQLNLVEIVEIMLKLPTTNPRICSGNGTTPATIAINSWLEQEVKNNFCKS